MRPEPERLLESLGLGVAQISVSVSDPKIIEVTFYGGQIAAASQDKPIGRKYRSEDAVSFPGNFVLPDAGLELSVIRSSKFSFSIACRRNDTLVVQGLGLTDRDNPAAIMVAWWTGTIEPYGVVKYSIRDDHAVAGYYISKMTPEEPGEDVAIGDTSCGLQGDYILNSQEVSGRTWGPHEWKLTSRGAITDLTWSEHGRIFCRGIGIPDPHDQASIIATYITV